ncbi:MAG: metal-dependent transcriptional regulator [Candidatus Hydrogenedentes bacterium]|nr:metal-dependent transcriptional regulator [Candidatus Hydrogenedentota bacterium]
MITAHLWFWQVLSGGLAVFAAYLLFRIRRSRRRLKTAAGTFGQQSVEVEDALKAAYALEIAENLNPEELTRSLGLPATMADTVTATLIASGWAVKDHSGAFRLKQTGKDRAIELIRAHRLWERYLVEKEGVPLHAVHAEADRREHDITSEELNKLDADLGHPAWGPHGHIIPEAGGREQPTAGRPLSADEQAGTRFRIISLKEEPAPLLAQLVALGLKPNVDVEVLKKEGDILYLRMNDSIIPLDRGVAQYLFVVPTPILSIPMGQLSVGNRARVVEVKGEGKHQRRMLDMGFVPGAELTVLRKAPLQDPVEFRVKRTHVALRREEADSILVEELPND